MQCMTTIASRRWSSAIERRRRILKSTAPNPSSIIAQVAGSATAGLIATLSISNALDYLHITSTGARPS